MSGPSVTGGEYPVLVRGRLQEPLSRWLWLVKWLLLIPHYIVLAFLWMAFFVVTVVAFFAILTTGRYPRGLFHFNLGVLRWSWRVAYYGYSALGTDRYPPFTLAEEPDYPATLDIEYPQRMSRGLALVKWWLLALPHYLILAILVGGATWTANASTGANSSNWTSASGGLIGLLVLFAGVALLFAARYPRGLYDLVMGLNRWVLRVTAYAALMTDTYPPFRLDQGGPEPAWPAGPTPSGIGEGTGADPTRAMAPQQGRPAAAGTGRRSATGPVIALVVGVLAVLPALAVTGLGGAGLWLNNHRDAAGFVSTGARQVSSTTAAITVEDVDLQFDRGTATWASPDRFGTLRVRATSQDGSPLFVGIAPQAALDGWLGRAAHDQVRNIGYGGITYERHTGEASAGVPSEQTFWTTSVNGAATQELTWPVQPGRWALVIARADGAPGVQARVDVGANIPSLTGIAVGLLVAGLILLAVAIGLIIIGAVGLGRRTAGPTGDNGPGHGPVGPPPLPRPAPEAELGDRAGAVT
jgi:uncharacterized protein DUF4389